MTTILLFIYGLLIVLPSVAVWCSISKRSSGWVAWFQPPLALIGPFIAAFIYFVMAWLPAYSGRCGGWLGETTPCGFGKYATETMYWAAMSMGIPALLGILLGVLVLIVGLIKRGKSCPGL